jgi:membrane-bound serine protease (ClpP class)
VGFYGLLFEFANPGYMVPGVVGGTCLLLGLFGMQTLPIHGAGLALVLLGMGFFAAEAFVPSHGALGIGGVVAFVLGALLLVDTDTPGFGVSRVLIGALAVVSLGFVGALSLLAARIRRRAAVSGTGTLVGVCGELLEASGTEGWMLLQGERWRVRASAALQAGARVRVTRVEGLVLEVERVIEGVA